MSQIYKIEKPNLSGINANELFTRMFQGEDIAKISLKASCPVYLAWNRFKYLKLSDNFSQEELWTVVKFMRKIQSRKSVIKNENGEYFTWLNLPGVEQFFHEVDLNTGGRLFTSVKDIDEKNKFKFISRGIVEEAIASSQLEGAHTTRQLAKQFLREGRKPKTEAEHMVLNNYKSMLAIEQQYKNHEIGLNTIFELHSMIVKNTVPSDEQRRFRNDSDNIVVSDGEEKFIYFEPPKSEFVKQEIERLIAFANDKMGEQFLHPIIKAIKLHFWVGYLHPFTNGNGRLARLLFYWYLLRRGYWAFAYLPISKIIRRSPAQYGNAYIYSEQDDLDLTYFIDYNIRKIKLAIKDFNIYLQEKSSENKQMRKIAKTKYQLNDRQIQLVQYYCNNQDEYTSIKMHMNIYQISRITAFRDLKELENLGFIVAKQVKRNVYYYGTEKIKELFK